MKSLLLLCVLLLIQSAPSEVSFTTEDGVRIYGDVYRTDAWQTDPLILLFHQGGANARAEYSTIIPILKRQGYSVVAIDQRRGGSRLGGSNRTMEYIGDVEYSYCDVYSDLQATLDYTKSAGFKSKAVAWGSSYSATLAIQLAARNSDKIAAVLAFSPAAGDPLEGCNPEMYLDTLRVPLLALRPDSEMEIESVSNQLKMIDQIGHATHVAMNGVHGSSMLNPQRTRNPTDDTWEVVLNFIAGALSDSYR